MHREWGKGVYRGWVMMAAAAAVALTTSAPALCLRPLPPSFVILSADFLLVTEGHFAWTFQLHQFEWVCGHCDSGTVPVRTERVGDL